MKNKFIITVIFLISNLVYSQVGIGTVLPQKTLHIAGDNSTIRIEQLNSTNSPDRNDGILAAPVYVDGNGDLTIGEGTGNGNDGPFNFLIEHSNFIPDSPYSPILNTGVAVTSGMGDSFVEGVIFSTTVVVPQSALIEVKLGVTILVKGSDVAAGPPYADLTYGQSIKIGLYFIIDIDNDGLSQDEMDRKYALNGQFYETRYGGITGYSYMNSDAYLTIPAGTHKVYFYGEVDDNDILNVASVGFGGAMDYIKVRLYN